MDPPPSPSLFQPYLLPGERILWTGRPKQGFALRGADAFLIPFSLLWLGFVTFMFVETINSPGAPDIILILFLAIGIYFTIGRFIHDAAVRRRMSYAVSDQRVLFAKGSQPRKISSLDFRQLPKLDLHESADGTGTISFDDGPSFFNYGRRSGLEYWVPSVITTSQLFRIANSRDVYRLIRDHSRAP